MTTKSNRKSQKPTPEQLAKWKARSARIDAQIIKHNIQNNEAMAFGIVELVAKNPRIEWEIVHNYLTRNNRVMIDKAA